MTGSRSSKMGYGACETDRRFAPTLSGGTPLSGREGGRSFLGRARAPRGVVRAPRRYRLVCSDPRPRLGRGPFRGEKRSRVGVIGVERRAPAGTPSSTRRCLHRCTDEPPLRRWAVLAAREARPPVPGTPSPGRCRGRAPARGRT